MIKTKGFSSFLPYVFLSFIVIARFLLQDLLFFNDYTPFYEVMFIYSWSFITQFKWSLIIIGVIGLFRDFLFLDAIGLSMLMFVVFAALINSQMEKIENRGFLLSWVFFLLSLVIIEIIRLVILSGFLDNTLLVVLVLSLKEIYFTTLGYPLFCFVFFMVFKRSMVRA
jgi:cell shape-determining protein MreD